MDEQPKPIRCRHCGAELTWSSFSYVGPDGLRTCGGSAQPNRHRPEYEEFDQLVERIYG